MRTIIHTLPFLPPLLLSATHVFAETIDGVGNDAAIAACNGFPAGIVKCLTTYSYVICLGDQGHGSEVETFDRSGTHCQQGIISQKYDSANIIGKPSAAITFQQFGYDNLPMTSAGTGTGGSSGSASASSSASGIESSATASSSKPSSASSVSAVGGTTTTTSNTAASARVSAQAISWSISNLKVLISSLAALPHRSSTESMTTVTSSSARAAESKAFE